MKLKAKTLTILKKTLKMMILTQMTKLRITSKNALRFSKENTTTDQIDADSAISTPNPLQKLRKLEFQLEI